MSVAIIWPAGASGQGPSARPTRRSDVAGHDPDTAFAFASVTKTFTAALVLQLVDEGRLRLDDKAAELLPDEGLHPAMTVRDLLDHTSGLNDFFRVTGIEPGAQQGHPPRLDDGRRAGVRAIRPRRAGHLLALLEHRLPLPRARSPRRSPGKPWATLVRERLLDPLGLDARPSSRATRRRARRSPAAIG